MVNDLKLGGGLRTKGVSSPTDTDGPLITIITVVFNGKDSLENTILSVLNLPYDHIEFIVIDGGSTDGTIDILHQYNDSIGYWVSEKDKGIYDAMNKGWALANTKSLILFLGSGDKILSLPDLAFLRNNADKIIFGSVMLENGPFPAVANWKLKLGNTLHHQALLVPKKLHPSPPFNISYPTYADYDFHLRLFLENQKFIFAEGFTAYALPGGVSSILKVDEMVKISHKNNGIKWSWLSYLYCHYQAMRASKYFYL